MTTTQYLRAFARFWWLIALALAAGILLASALGGATPPAYTSTASVQVTPTPPGRPTAVLKTQALFLAQTRMPTYATLAVDPALGEAVLRRLPGTGLDVPEVMDRVTVRVPDRSTILVVSVHDSQRLRTYQLARESGAALASLISDYEKRTSNGHPLLRAQLRPGAVTPPASVAPPTWRNSTLVALAALLVGLALAVIAARLFPRLRDESVVTEVSGLPVVGVVPGGGGSPLAAKRVRRAGYQRALEELRTSVYLLRQDQGCLKVALTSPRPAAGLSRVGNDVAAALTELDARVLLVDADLAGDEPTPGESSTGADGRGLAAYLAGTLPLDDLIRRDGGSAVDVVSPGPHIDATDELLHARAFDTLLDDAAGRYDYVLVLAPATDAGTGAAAVAARCDATVVAVDRRTRARQLIRAVNQLRHVGARVRGVLILS